MKKTLILFLFVLISSPASSNVVEDKDICLFYTTQVEQNKKIKENILSTISLVETGRNSNNNIVGYPWPWTIAYQGKGRYFDSKQEAIAKVKQLQKNGVKSIDVGCMQINLFYHKDAFASLDDAFDPKTNVEYAGDFINRLYKKHGNWGAAATGYHSHEPNKAYKYEDKLIKVWARLEKHLADGGKLFSGPKAQQLANAFLDKKVSESKMSETTPVLVALESEPEGVYQVKANYKSTDAAYDLSGVDFAKQWRARKLTEYRLKKAEETNPVYRSNATRVGENL